MPRKAKPITLREVALFMKKLGAAGYAVAVFLPAELGDVDAEDVEDAMIAAGNEKISYLKSQKQHNEKQVHD